MDDSSGQQFFLEMNTRLRDLEEKQKIMQDRVLLTGKSLVEERDKNFKEIQEMKKSIFHLKEDILSIKELLNRMTEQFANAARKEELMILQRQFDLFREG